MWKLSLCMIMYALSLGLAQAQILAQEVTTEAAVAEIEFTSLVHDFGSIEKDVPVEASFTFKNTGLTSLVITKVQGSCGCTVTNYTQGKVLPGQEGMVKATYNAAKSGAFNKSITVTSNTPDRSLTLHIKGVVK